MDPFEILFERSIPHVLVNIFLSLDPRELEGSRLVCKKWNDFIKKEMMENVKIGKELRIKRDRFLWMESDFDATTIPGRIYSAAYDAQHNTVYLHRGDKIECLDLSDPTGAPIGVIDHEEPAGSKMLLTDKYLIVSKDGACGVSLYSKDTMDIAHFIDLSMLVEEDEDYDPDSPHSHISTVQTVGNEIYILSQSMTMDREDISMKLHKFGEQKKCFWMDLVCEVPLDGASSPNYTKIGERHIVVYGHNSRVLVYNHVTGQKIIDEVWEVPNVLRAKLDSARNFFGFVQKYRDSDDANSKFKLIPFDLGSNLLRFVDLDSRAQLRKEANLYPHPDYISFGQEAVAFPLDESDTYIDIEGEIGLIRVLYFAKGKFSMRHVPGFIYDAGTFACEDRFLIHTDIDIEKNDAFEENLVVNDMLKGDTRILYRTRGEQLTVLGDRALICLTKRNGIIFTFPSLKTKGR
jgi:hypothetical protein